MKQKYFIEPDKKCSSKILPKSVKEWLIQKIEKSIKISKNPLTPCPDCKGTTILIFKCGRYYNLRCGDCGYSLYGKPKKYIFAFWITEFYENNSSCTQK